MNQIIKAEIIIQLILDSLCITGGLFLPNDSMLINTAKGHSAIMENILNPMENDWHQMIGKIGISLSFLIAIICTLVELTCYLIIHVQVYRNDEKIKESIFVVRGMTCGACSGAIERYFNGNLAGIKSCSVSLITNKASIKYDYNTIKTR